MKEIYQLLHWHKVLVSVLLVAAGVVLIIWPDLTARTICVALAILLTVAGIGLIIENVVKRHFFEDYPLHIIPGIVLILIGCFVALRYKVIISIIPTVLGFGILVSGIGKIAHGLELRTILPSKGNGVLIMAAVNILVGLVGIFHPFRVATLVFQMIGAGLVFSGITDLITAVYVAKKEVFTHEEVVDRTEESRWVN